MRAVRHGRPHSAPSRNPRSRRGAFLVIMLVGLLVTLMVVGSLVRVVLMHRRQLGREAQRVQATWLAESGLERAASRLAQNPDYSGETWMIDASELRRRDGAAIVIRIEEISDQPQQRRVVVEATYPVQGPEQARVTRQTTLPFARKP